MSDRLREMRAAGMPFEDAWLEAVRPGRPIVMSTTKGAPAGAVRWPTDRTDRLAWQAAIRATQDAWQRAYERWPQTERDSAVVLLARALDQGMELGPALPSAA